MQMLLHSLNRDFSRKYYPRFDEATYDKEMEWTEGALADFFDRPAQQSIQAFEKIATYSKATVIAGCLVLALSLHKLPLIRRIGNKWVLATMKIGLVCGIAYGTNYFIEVLYRKQFNREVFGRVRQQYKLYKLTGDITQLNPQIGLEQLPAIPEDTPT